MKNRVTLLVFFLLCVCELEAQTQARETLSALEQRLKLLELRMTNVIHSIDTERQASEMERLESTLRDEMNATNHKMEAKLSASQKQVELLQTRLCMCTSEDQVQILQNRLSTTEDLVQNLTKEMKRRSLCELHGFTLDGDVCYYFSATTDGTKNWEQSRQWCRDRQSDLIVINSKEKQDLLERVAKSYYVWIGLTDREQEGIYKWVDGTPLASSPTFWRAGQPDGGRGHDCVWYYDDGSARGWFDYGCTDTNRWMCERVV